jgi:hypothetical protein
MTLTELSDALSVRVADLCAQLLPAGRQVGSQWIVGNVFGDPGDSMYVELSGPKQGLWYDHAAGNGGDLLELIGQNLTLPRGRAAQWARDFLGIRDDYRPTPRLFDPLKHGHRRDASEPYSYGSAAWPYHDADGNIHAYVVRFDRPGTPERPNGSKDTLPLRLLPPDGVLPDPQNPRHWRWKGWPNPEPVPLFNLHLLARRPNDPVLIVEGEKTAVAASKLFPSHVVVTWQGGCKRVGRAAIEPLLDRATPIVLWPDADKPGRDAMVYLKARIPSARLVNLPDTLPDGWDLADPVPDGVSIQGLLDAAGDLPRPVPAQPVPASPNPLDDLHYDPNSGQWWIRNAWGDYAQINSDRVRTHLTEHGVSHVKDQTGSSDLDRELLRRTRDTLIEYAGPLAGHRAGLYGTILVTRSVNPLPGTPGSCARLQTYLYNLLDQNDDQYWRLIFWLALRRQAVLTGVWRASQALALVGPAACGKSFVQSAVITRLLGNRIAKPYRYMSGATDFNGDLFTSEHLCIEDEAPGRDIHSRRTLGSNIKSMLFSQNQSCHPKNRQAITLKPIWAMSISLNDEPENLQVLPPLDPSLMDKLIILRCVRQTLPWPGPEIEVLKDILDTELAAFAHYLDGLAVPEPLFEPRCGLKAYQHPAILEELMQLSPEHQLIGLIDTVIFENEFLTWRGTAADLETALRDSKYAREADRLFRFNTACGVYLARLHEQDPTRIRKSKTNGKVRWDITPPATGNRTAWT